MSVGLSREQLQMLLQNYRNLRQQGATEENNVQMMQIANTLRYVQRQQRIAQQHRDMKINEGQDMTKTDLSGVPEPKMDGIKVDAGSETAATNDRFSSSQLMLLRNQIIAYRCISKNMPIPPRILQTLQSASLANGTIEEHNVALSENIPVKEEPGDEKRAAALKESKKFLETPYETLKRPISLSEHRALASSVIIPGLFPTGIDSEKVLTAKKTLVAHHIARRIKELEDYSDQTLTKEYATGKVTDSLRLRALIELKSLKLLKKQQQMRATICAAPSKYQNLLAIQERANFRKLKRPSLREARLTEALERQQRSDKERREKQKKLDYLQGICAHGREILNRARTLKQKAHRLTRSIQNYHTYIEKEEARRLERTAKQRLQALKADDEEAYLKLIDQAKDTRITHLLKQTNVYLDSLAQAVKEQQKEAHDEEKDSLDADDGAEGGIKNEDYYQVAHRIKEDIVEQPTILVGGQLKDYQLKGLQWMISLYNNKLNGILADEMGLGKTIQTISLVTYLIEKKRQNGPFLIVVPLSTLTNWTLEFDRWAPSVSKIVYKGTPQTRKVLASHVRHTSFQVLLTTYEYIIKDRPVLSKTKWVYLVVDEGHRMKNSQSKLSATLQNYYPAKYRLILTGTPLQNNLPELWALLNFVLPKIFNSVKSFDEWFNSPFANTGSQDRMELNEEESLLVIRRLHKVLRPFLLRRLKKDVESELPDKIEKIVKCQLSALQSKLYTQMKKHGMLFVSTGQKKTGFKGLQNTVMQLRKICNHPFVFEEVESTIDPSGLNYDLLWRVSGKFELLDRVLPKFFATNHRVLVFFQMTQIMNIMEDYLRYRGWKYLRLDGSTKSDDRSALLEEFNAENSDIFLFLLSTRAGGLGLNLQTADTVVIFDSDWNPHQDLQAQDRAHRIGQTKEVRIFRLITEKSIEENILARAQFKLDIDGKVIQAGKFDQKSTAEEREAFLRSLLENDTEDMEPQEKGELEDDELNELLARDDSELKLFKKMDQELDRTSRYGKSKRIQRLIDDDELPEIYQRDATEDMVDEAFEELGRGARVRNSVIYEDNLTEEQWLEALTEDGDSVQAKAQHKRNRALKRQAAKLKRQGISVSDSSDAASQTSSVSEMPAKRRKGSTTAERPDKKIKLSSESCETTPSAVNGKISNGTSRSRSNRSRLSDAWTSLEPEQQAQLSEAFQTLYDTVVESIDDEDGERRRSALFMHLPSKREYPDYYALIEEPIALDKIKKKIHGRQYASLDDILEDFDLMFRNAKMYNDENSLVYEDAEVMEKEVAVKAKELRQSLLTDDD